MKGLLYLFRRYKLASSLNLLGLVIAFTGCYILLTQINFIGRFNHGIKDYENIRRIYIRGAMGDDKWNVTCSRGVIENFKKCPQVQSLGYLRYWGEIEFDKDGSILTSPSYLISDDMLTTINTELVDGTLDGSKAVDGGIIIPASFAEKYFGEVMVAGKSMKQSDGSELNVVGVYKDFPVNSNFANAIYVSMGKESLDDFNNWNYDTYIRTEENVDTDALNATLKKIFGDVMLEKEWRSDQYEYFMNLLQFFALPLDRTYMEGYDALIDQGNKTVCYILQLTFVLLLLIALINFANFSMAQAPIRLRSINTRKVWAKATECFVCSWEQRGVSSAFVPLRYPCCWQSASVGGNTLANTRMALLLSQTIWTLCSCWQSSVSWWAYFPPSIVLAILPLFNPHWF